MRDTERYPYEVQSDSDKDKWYKVVLEPRGQWIKGSCNCAEHIWQGGDCQHIKRAVECYNLGL
jgi:hypothetical protein